MFKIHFIFYVWICTIWNSVKSDVFITSRSVTSSLNQYENYKDVDMIHLHIPQDTSFASFKFTADETRMSIFPCNIRNVSVYMKHGAPPVINPDGSPFPKLFKNITRNPTYNLQIQTDKKESYINITSPDPGAYIVAAFISYTDPKNRAISQEGLRADCDAFLEASLFVSKLDNPLMITDDNLFPVNAELGESRFFKFFVPGFNDQAVLFINNIIYPEKSEYLLFQIQANKPPSKNSNVKNSTIGLNKNSQTVFFATSPDCWHYIKFKFEGKRDNTSVGNFTFQLKFISNELPTSSNYYSLLQNETYFNNSETKTFHNYKIENLVPYKHYDLIREATSETFFYSFELEKELDSKVPIAINMTNSHFSLLKFRLREGSDVGGTLQFILAFKPRIDRSYRSYFKSEPENHVIVACLRRGAMEIPTWPNKCSFNGVETISQLMLNKTNDNTTILIPYPESGTWYATLKLFCGECEPCNCSKSCQKQYEDCVIDCELDCNTPWECQMCTTNCSEIVINTDGCKMCDCDGPCLKNNISCSSSVLFDIGSHPCIWGQCSRNGKCMFLVSDGIVFSTCVCMNRYRGWDCSDNSQANAFYLVVIELILLVFSNLAFLPAVYIAFKRKYYVESLSYFSICFFSTFYHACDSGENLINFCMVRLSALQFADFFCAILSIWVTLVAIADLPSIWSNVSHMLGAIVLAFFTTINKTSLWVFLVPVSVGVALIAGSWVVKYRKVGVKFAKRRYLFYKLPIGIAVVIVGLVCYAFLQTESNYKYLHSLWHILMAVALILILPKPNTFLPEVIL